MPQILDHKMLRMLSKKCPLAYREFFSRKYLLPQYRQPDYVTLDFENYMSFDRCVQWAAGVTNQHDEVMRCALANTFAALHCRRPTLYLERELGEALLRADLPEGFETGDIKWIWKAFKIVLPLGLISLQRDDGIHSLVHFNVCEIGPDKGVICPIPIARELDKLGTEIKGREHNYHWLERLSLRYPVNGICVSSALDKPDYEADQTVYSLVKPWGEIRIGDYHALEGDLYSPFPQDKADKEMLHRLEHLVIQTMLFLSAAPLEYEPERMIRPMKREGKNVIPGLYDARFVGQSQIRPHREAEAKATMNGQPTGRHTAAHWVRGHWKRQVIGEGRADRKWIFIMTYQTSDLEEKKS